MIHDKTTQQHRERAMKIAADNNLTDRELFLLQYGALCGQMKVINDVLANTQAHIPIIAIQSAREFITALRQDLEQRCGVSPDIADCMVMVHIMSVESMQAVVESQGATKQ